MYVKSCTQEDTPVTGSAAEPQGASPPRQLELAPPGAAEFVICDHTIELFFHWVKCVLGYRHWLSQGVNGVRLQVYAAFISSPLISLWVGRAPTKRTYEMLCFYLSGWATESALVAHIDRLHLKAPPSRKK